MKANIKQGILTFIVLMISYLVGYVAMLTYEGKSISGSIVQLVPVQVFVACFLLSLISALVPKKKPSNSIRIVVAVVIVITLTIWHFVSQELINNSQTDTSSSEEYNTSLKLNAEAGDDSTLSLKDVSSGFTKRSSHAKTDDSVASPNDHKIVINQLEENLLLNGIKSAAQADWNSFMMYLRGYNGEKSHINQDFLIIAAENGAPSDVIDEILNRGAVIDYTVYARAVISDNPRTIKLLESRGLALDMRNEEGEMAILNTVLVDYKFESFDYLVDKNAFETSESSRDILDVLIQRTIDDNTMPTALFKKIFSRKVVVLPKHEALLNDLKAKKPVYYQVLTEKVPELFRS